MKRLTRLTVVVGIPLAALILGNVQAQTPTTPKPPPTSAVFPYANPVLYSYQRQRELREQRALEKNIQDLQRLEVLKAARAKAADPEASGEPKSNAKPSVTYKTDSAPAKKPTATKTAEKTVEPAVAKTEPPEAKKKVGYAPTYSNYSSLLKKN
jgi:hypothetical protein